MGQLLTRSPADARRFGYCPRRLPVDHRRAAELEEHSEMAARIDRSARVEVSQQDLNRGWPTQPTDGRPARGTYEPRHGLC